MFLNDLTGFLNVNSIDGDLRIINNNSLKSLVGLNNVNPSSIVKLIIHSNDSLSICAVQSVCEYLMNPNGEIDIYYNEMGCNSVEEVEEACAVSVIENHLKTSLKIHPNPFSTSTTIEYYLNQPLNASIYIYNNLGEQVDLIQEHQQSGKQQFTWNAQGLTPGVYYFRLEAGEQRVNGKVLLMK